jgi:hypothetical protein
MGRMEHVSCSAHGSLVDKKSHSMPTVGGTDDRCIRLCSDGCAQCRREGYQASGEGKSAFWALCVWRPAAYNSRRGGGLEHRSLVTGALRRFLILFSRLRSIRVCTKSVRDKSSGLDARSFRRILQCSAVTIEYRYSAPDASAGATDNSHTPRQRCFSGNHPRGASALAIGLAHIECGV